MTTKTTVPITLKRMCITAVRFEFVFVPIVERRKINAINANYEKLKEIAFDSSTKSYEYHLLKPEINYNYRIRWER